MWREGIARRFAWSCDGVAGAAYLVFVFRIKFVYVMVLCVALLLHTRVSLGWLTAKLLSVGRVGTSMFIETS